MPRAVDVRPPVGLCEALVTRTGVGLSGFVFQAHIKAASGAGKLRGGTGAV